MVNISHCMRRSLFTCFLNENFKNEVMIKLIKVIDIFFASFIYILAAFIVSFILDKYIFPKFDEEKENKKNFILSVLELCFIIGIIGVISYISRNLIHMIPFPLEGLYGFKHLMVYEVKSGALFTAYVILLNTYLQKKLALIKDRFNKYVYKE